MRILLVEQDLQFADYIQRRLEHERNSVTVCYDGAAGLKAAQSQKFNIVAIDVATPVLDGLEVTRRLRLEKVDIPILLLTGSDAPDDIVCGLNAGADDCVAKPFAFDVFLARLRARTRSHAIGHTQLRSGDLLMDVDSRIVRRGNTLLELTRTEFSLLECLLRSAGRVARREHLIESVWGDKEISDNNLEVHICFLRTKVDAPGHPKLIKTERGIGYYLESELGFE